MLSEAALLFHVNILDYVDRGRPFKAEGPYHTK